MGKWSLNKKIWAVLGLLIVAFVGSVYLALSRMNTLKDDLNEVTGVHVRRNQLTSDLLDNQRVMTSSSLEIILQTDDQKMEALKKTFADRKEDQMKTLIEYRKIASERGKELSQQYEKDFNTWMVSIEKSRIHAVKNENKEAYEILESANGVRAQMRGYLSEMDKLTTENLAKKTAEANASASSALQLTLIFAVSAILASIAIAYFVLRAVTQNINQVVTSLYDSSAQVGAAAGQIASASEELSQATTEQAASLQQTSASIEEMNAMVGKNSENAGQTSQESQTSKERALQGKQVVEDMIRSMDAINASNETIMKQINHSNEQFSNIAKVIEEIGNKTKVINDIVFQTKLLSFNASVEAARAGEHGRGFAVVAEEVGNLAQMSGNAAKEISSMLEESIKNVQGIVAETKQTVGKLAEEGKAVVENGSRVARECGDVLDSIVTNVGGVSNMANEIAKASEEQSRGITEITRAMNQLDQATQQNAATSEEAASSAEELSAQADALKAAVARLVVTIQGGSAASEPAQGMGSGQMSSSGRSGQQTKTAGKVVPLKKEAARHHQEPSTLKKASGDADAPAYDDPRFKDI